MLGEIEAFTLPRRLPWRWTNRQSTKLNFERRSLFVFYIRYGRQLIRCIVERRLGNMNREARNRSH